MRVHILNLKFPLPEILEEIGSESVEIIHTSSDGDYILVDCAESDAWEIHQALDESFRPRTTDRKPTIVLVEDNRDGYEIKYLFEESMPFEIVDYQVG